MADLNLTDLFDSATTKRAPRRVGKTVPCDECGKLHYRKATRLVRTENPRRSHPTSGKWLCSKICGAAVAKKSHIISPCLKCGAIVERRRSQVKQSVFCSRACTDTYGLKSVRCCWPECTETMPCRTFPKRDRRGNDYIAYKIALTREGRYTKYIVCERHRKIAEKYLGRATRLTTGRIRMLVDPDEAYAIRGASGKFLRAVLFERAGGTCQDCDIALDFFAPPKTWQVDHIVPMFRGGQTKLSNLRVVCAACHDKKTAIEKSEVGRERHSLTRIHRWQTHYQKDQIIDRLRARLTALGEPTD